MDIPRREIHRNKMNAAVPGMHLEQRDMTARGVRWKGKHAQVRQIWPGQVNDPPSVLVHDPIRGHGFGQACADVGRCGLTRIGIEPAAVGDDRTQRPVMDVLVQVARHGCPLGERNLAFAGHGPTCVDGRRAAGSVRVPHAEGVRYLNQAQVDILEDGRRGGPGGVGVCPGSLCSVFVGRLWRLFARLGRRWLRELWPGPFARRAARVPPKLAPPGANAIIGGIQRGEAGAVTLWRVRVVTSGQPLPLGAYICEGGVIRQIEKGEI